MADTTDSGLDGQEHERVDDGDGVSWPLVERRRRDGAPPDGVDRRRSRLPHISPTLTAAPMWPFRIAAFAGALIRALPELREHNTTFLVVTLLAGAYTVVASLIPVPYRDEPDIRKRIVLEQSLNVAAVIITGASRSKLPRMIIFSPKVSPSHFIR